MITKIEENVLMRYIESLYLASPDDFLLIEIGANDGYCCDRMWPFVLKDAPNAIMVEPVPGYFNKLKSNYGHLNNIRFENIAISDTEGINKINYIPQETIEAEKVTFRMEGAPHLWKEHWAGGLGTFYTDKNNLACPELNKFKETIEVETKTFQYLFDKYNISSYKNVVLQTDCEGHDFVLMNNYPFSAKKPRIYISEIYGKTRYPPSHPNYGTAKGMYSQEEEDKAVKLLTSMGYEVYHSNDLIGISKGL